MHRLSSQMWVFLFFLLLLLIFQKQNLKLGGLGHPGQMKGRAHAWVPFLPHKLSVLLKVLSYLLDIQHSMTATKPWGVFLYGTPVGIAYFMI